MLSGYNELAVLEGSPQSVGDLFDPIATAHRKATTNVLDWMEERLGREGDRTVVGSILYVYAVGVEAGRIPVFSLQLSEAERLNIARFVQQYYQTSLDMIWDVLYGLMETAREGKDGSPQILAGQGLTWLDRLYNGGVADAIKGVTSTVVQSVAAGIGLDPSIVRILLLAGVGYVVFLVLQQQRMLRK